MHFTYLLSGQYSFLRVFLFSVPPHDVPAESGAGEMGKAFVVDAAHKNESERLFRINSFNLYASDRISLNRTLPDMRPEG